MFSFPSSRKLLIPAASLLLVALLYRLLISNVSATSRVLLARSILSQVPRGTLVESEEIRQYLLPIRHPSQAHLGSPQSFSYDYNTSSQTPPDLIHLDPLRTCSTKPNPYTNHIRLSNLVYHVSSTPPDTQPDGVQKFNPTIIPLPHWSKNRYLLVSRVVTEGLHQESLLCEANICLPPNSSASNSNTCSPSDLEVLGYAGGLRCATKPVIINIPPTPAERCTGAWTTFPDIPGFHDPRIFWSGKGEPLIVVNSASRYGCVGLWIADLRTLYQPLQKLLEQKGHGPGALTSYPHLTELMRLDRSAVEKNWMLFFPSKDEAYVHYDMVPHTPDAATSGSGRAFAKLIGNGYTTPNLADPNEASCFDAESLDARGKKGHWHQGSNALKLLLCTREEAKRGTCHEDEEGKSVHFAVMHHKFSNEWDLPLRYERWLVLWEGKKPFRLLAKSKFPVLFANETASGWTGEENWASATELARKMQRRWEGGSVMSTNATTWLNISDDLFPGQEGNATHTRTDANNEAAKKNWSHFTYTPSISWAWRPKTAEIRREDRDGGAEDGSYLHSLNVGYLDDEIIVGIGLGDTAQAFAGVKASTLLQCLDLCPSAKEGATDKEREELKE